MFKKETVKDKIYIGFYFTKYVASRLDQEADRIGLNRGAYIRLCLLEKLGLDSQREPTEEPVANKNVTGMGE